MNTRTERAVREIVAVRDEAAGDWQPHHWSTLDAAVDVLAEEVGRIDRRNERKPTTTAPKPKWVTVKRPKDPPELVAARKAVRERSGGYCEAGIPDVCHGNANEAHHVLRRSQGGAHTPENLVDLCGAGGCHDAAHGNVGWAKRHGLIRSPGGALIAPVAGCSLSCDVDHRPTADQT